MITFPFEAKHSTLEITHLKRKITHCNFQARVLKKGLKLLSEILCLSNDFFLQESCIVSTLLPIQLAEAHNLFEYHRVARNAKLMEAERYGHSATH